MGSIWWAARLLLRRQNLEALASKFWEIHPQPLRSSERNLHYQMVSSRWRLASSEPRSAPGFRVLWFNSATLGRRERHLSSQTDEARRTGVFSELQSGRKTPRVGLLRQMDSHLVDKLWRAGPFVSWHGRLFRNLLELARRQTRRQRIRWLRMCSWLEEMTLTESHAINRHWKQPKEQENSRNENFVSKKGKVQMNNYRENRKIRKLSSSNAIKQYNNSNLSPTSHSGYPKE